MYPFFADSVDETYIQWAAGSWKESFPGWAENLSREDSLKEQ